MLYSWLAFRHEFKWRRAYLLVWWVAKVSPVWLCATLYLLCTSLGVVAAAGMLFQQQMLWALTGVSYVDALKLANAAPYSIRPIFAKRSLRQRLTDVFGDQPAWQWLLPQFSGPATKCMTEKRC